MESHDPAQFPDPCLLRPRTHEEEARATDHEAPWQVDILISTSPSPERPLAIFLSNILEKTDYSVLSKAIRYRA